MGLFGLRVLSLDANAGWYVGAGVHGGLDGGGVWVDARAKKAAAALRLASSLPMASIEFDLMQHLPNRSAAGPIRSAAARTRDVIDAVATICRVRGVTFANEDRVTQLGIRLEVGLPPELGPLAAELGSAIIRVDYLNLLSRGISTTDQIRSLPDEQLNEILGDTAGLACASIAGRRARINLPTW